MGPKLITWREIESDQGSIAALQWPDEIPFQVNRIFYIFNVKPGDERGKHAHKKLEQFIIPISGSFKLNVEDQNRKVSSWLLNKKTMGVYIPPMTWTHLVDFTENAVCLVLASDKFLEADYVRNYDEFTKLVKK